jgi:ABC-type uncharacterized transport system auxiliary subunit
MKTIYLFLILILIGMQSCGERTLIRHYYILELPDTGYIGNQDTMQGEWICEILKTRIPPAYDQQRIANRKRSNEISYYQYHYWAMNPAENLTSLIEQQIKLSQIFAYSSRENLQGVPDYQIVSDVYRLEVEDNDDLFYLRMEMQLELIDYKKGNMVIAHKFDRTQELASRDLNLFASELSIIFQEEMHIFMGKIRSYLARTNSQTPSAK